MVNTVETPTKFINAEPKMVSVGTESCPYYEIEYRDNNTGELNRGFGSRDPSIVAAYLRNYFDIDH